MSLQVAVIGAGVIGLSTAVCLQERIPQAEVTIIADQFLEKTLSAGAGALFRGDISVHSDLKLNENWLHTSYVHFTKLANKAAAEEAAVNAAATAAKNQDLYAENLVSSILSLKQSSSIASTLNNLQNFTLNTDKSKEASDDSKNSVPKLVMENVDKNFENSSSANPNNGNNGNNMLSVNNSTGKSQSRSPSPSRLRSKSPNNKKEPISDHGVRIVHGFHLTEVCEQAVGNEMMSKLVNDWHAMTIDQLNNLTSNIHFKYGYEYTSVIIEPYQYLRFLMSKFLSNKGQTINRTISFRSINDFEFLHRNFHVVFNCTGLAAKQLVSDHQMVPIRGQTVTVHAPWIKSFYTFDSHYIYPRFDGTVVLGGCKQYGCWDQNINEFDRNAILSKCIKLLPDLAEADITSEFVGLRPHRAEIRVERERINSPNKENNREWLNVVHNYGHGGNGFTYSYGTAVHAVKLIDDLVNQHDHLELLP